MERNEAIKYLQGLEHLHGLDNGYVNTFISNLERFNESYKKMVNSISIEDGRVPILITNYISQYMYHYEKDPDYAKTFLEWPDVLGVQSDIKRAIESGSISLDEAKEMYATKKQS